jgi:hypothetical protein
MTWGPATKAACSRDVLAVPGVDHDPALGLLSVLAAEQRLDVLREVGSLGDDFGYGGESGQEKQCEKNRN